MKLTEKTSGIRFEIPVREIDSVENEKGNVTITTSGGEHFEVSDDPAVIMSAMMIARIFSHD